MIGTELEMLQEEMEESSIKSKDADFVISGFWEPWKTPINPGDGNNTTPSYYENDVKYFDNVIYSFMTLDKYPNPDAPRMTRWNGTCLYDSMTRDCAQNTMRFKDGWHNP